jgi:hypothetical protein
VLANLTGVGYWWGWVPTCGLAAILSAPALHALYLPSKPFGLLELGRKVRDVLDDAGVTA